MKEGGGSRHDDEGGILLFRTPRAKFTRWMTIRGAASVKLVRVEHKPRCAEANWRSRPPGGGLRSVSWGVVGFRGYNGGEA